MKRIQNLNRHRNDVTSCHVKRADILGARVTPLIKYEVNTPCLLACPSNSTPIRLLPFGTECVIRLDLLRRLFFVTKWHAFLLRLRILYANFDRIWPRLGLVLKWCDVICSNEGVLALLYNWLWVLEPNFPRIIGLCVFVGKYLERIHYCNRLDSGAWSIVMWNHDCCQDDFRAKYPNKNSMWSGQSSLLLFWV